MTTPTERERLEQDVAYIAAHLPSIYPDTRDAVEWFMAPQQLLGDLSPAQKIVAGEISDVAAVTGPSYDRARAG